MMHYYRRTRYYQKTPSSVDLEATLMAVQKQLAEVNQLQVSINARLTGINDFLYETLRKHGGEGP